MDLEETMESLYRPGQSCKWCRQQLLTFFLKSRNFEDILSQIFCTFE